ncbi:hypothetical protein PIB30_043192 [Stylosanthes scabra]|uniref:Uncharacterized protein n=1 Tax=Stylosanthes scabra TaxID=79078 RepID=A0ABU6WIY3_9FABA|nr:hypothetical protein [Stylosanthes scabra]
MFDSYCGKTKVFEVKGQRAREEGGFEFNIKSKAKEGYQLKIGSRIGFEIAGIETRRRFYEHITVIRFSENESPLRS